jgi:hypothetical protein
MMSALTALTCPSKHDISTKVVDDSSNFHTLMLPSPPPETTYSTPLSTTVVKDFTSMALVKGESADRYT